MDPWTDESTRSLRGVLMQPLVAHATATLAGIDAPRVLDVGCGDLLLARLVPERWRIDGWDPNPNAAAAATRTADDLGDRVRVVELDDVDRSSIHLAVLNSVTQYLSGTDELAGLFSRIAPLLVDERDGTTPGSVVVTDVVDPPRRRWREGLDLLWYLSRHAGPHRALVATLRTADRSPGDLRAFPASDVVGAAATAGLEATRLPTNLTALRTRASYVLAAGSTPQGGRQ